MKYNGYEYSPEMSVEAFEEANTDKFQEQRIESNPEKAHLVKDGDLDAYWNDFDIDEMFSLMKDCYVDFLDANN